MLKTKQIKSHESKLGTYNLVPTNTGQVYIVSKLNLSVIFILYAGILPVKEAKH